MHEAPSPPEAHRHRSTERRARPASAAHNDLAIRDAAVRVVAHRGWDHATLGAVAAEAGLTEGAMYVRYPDKHAFGAALWQETLAPAFATRIDTAMAAALGHPDAPSAQVALEPFADPDDTLLAAVELIHAAHFDAALDAVRADAAAALTPWCSPRRRHGRVDAARAAAAANLAFGLVLTSFRPWQSEAVTTPMLDRFAHAFAYPIAPQPLPKDRARHLDAHHFAEDDPRIDRAYQATVKVIGEFGYHHATIARICRAADVSAGFLYKRYASKRELFTAAMDAMMASNMQANAAFATGLSLRNGDGIAEAVHWREFQRPNLRTNRALELEANRLARYDDAMRVVRNAADVAYMDAFLDVGSRRERAQRLGFMHTEMALGLGVLMTAHILPSVWRLPYDCVTVPLTAQGIV